MAEQQVNRDTYTFDKYCVIERWSSYWHQIKEILALKPDSVLEIGVGDKVLASYLKNNTAIKYSNLDIAQDLQPDIVGSVDDMKNISDNSFDLVCAFEVLEHLPFEKFGQSLNELKRVSKQSIIISLPHWGRHFSLEIRLPLLGKLRFQYKFNLWPIKHVFNGQHYWEIGKADYNLKTIKQAITETGLKINNDYIAFASPYHHFFILEKITSVKKHPEQGVG